MNLVEMQNEVCEWAMSKGWEPDYGRTFDDECALLHSEVSEALEAYREAEFEDRVDPFNGKPWGVGSELADVLIRLLHYSKVRNMALFDFKLPESVASRCVSFGGECTVMHTIISQAATYYDEGCDGLANVALSTLYSMLLYSCSLHEFNLEFEYKRKMDYNMTRERRHGGKVM